MLLAFKKWMFVAIAICYPSCLIFAQKLDKKDSEPISYSDEELISTITNLTSKDLSSNLTDLNNKRLLFIYPFFVDSTFGDARIRLKEPTIKDIAIKFDKPWEGRGSLYFSIFKDDSIYRLYYRGVDIDWFESSTPKNIESLENKFCYAESKDGIHWVKPDLKINDFNGNKRNNIILTSSNFGDSSVELCDNASFFKDLNPKVSPDAKYKAIVCVDKPKRGLMVFKSADAIHWVPMVDSILITDGAFDSQNVAFWDSVANKYRIYWRIFKENAVRDIRTAVSDNFIDWSDYQDLEYFGRNIIPDEQLYTNQILPYYRAPYILLGIPTRYVDRGWSKSMEKLPEFDYREKRFDFNAREGTAVTESIIIAGVNGKDFLRWEDAFIRPGIQRPGTWNYGQLYTGWGLVETKSDLMEAPKEISLFSSENYKSQDSTGTRLRRYTLRVDGFASLSASMEGGGLLSKPFILKGKDLDLNFSTSAAGIVKVGFLDEQGNPIPGFTDKDCYPIFGDEIERKVEWLKNKDLSSLIGRKVRLYFFLKDADIFSFKFSE